MYITAQDTYSKRLSGRYVPGSFSLPTNTLAGGYQASTWRRPPYRQASLRGQYQPSTWWRPPGTLTGLGFPASIDEATAWAKENPLMVAGIAIGALLLFTGGRR